MNPRFPDQVNPAAVLGYSLPLIFAEQAAPLPVLDLDASRNNGGSGALDLNIMTPDPVFRQAIEAVPFLSALKENPRWNLSRFGSMTGKVTYTEMLQLMAALYQVGVRFDSELANRQANAAAIGVPADVATAYRQFSLDATAFLQKVDALGLVALASRKGVRQVENPFRALALMHGSSAVMVNPDPFQAGYVHVTLRGCFFRTDALTLRALAYDHYEALGLRVQLFEI